MLPHHRAALLFVALGLSPIALSSRADTLPADPRDVEKGRQLGFTRTSSDLDGDRHPEGIVLVNALTGERDPARGSEVILAITAPEVDGKPGKLLWARHVMRDSRQPAHDGEVTAVDLDGDGASELILTWDRSLTDKATDRWGEIYTVRDPLVPQRVWEGPWERDTRRDPTVREGDREWFRREIDFAATRKEAGRALVFKKKYTVIAGVALAAPKLVPERIAVSLR